jgi:glyoxylase-like metal-dependent hydrolase (beta-lactamase superfamily II)
MQCKLFGVPFKPVPSPDQWLRDDEALACGCGVALHTPGHTPGSMSFWFPEAKLLIAGDTLFRRGIGRTDLWGGDHGAIERSIRQRLYTLDEDATVVTGHGPRPAWAMRCARTLRPCLMAICSASRNFSRCAVL